VFMESIYPLHSLAELGSFLVASPQQQVVLPNTQLQITTFVFTFMTVKRVNANN